MSELPKSNLRLYIARLLVFSILVTSLYAIGARFAPGAYVTMSYPFLGVFFFIVTFLVHYLLTSKGLSPNRFINTYMLTTVARLLLFLSVLLVYALLRKEDALAFTLAFLFFYVFFTVFEIIFLLKHQRGAGKTS